MSSGFKMWISGVGCSLSTNSGPSMPQFGRRLLMIKIFIFRSGKLFRWQSRPNPKCIFSCYRKPFSFPLSLSVSVFLSVSGIQTFYLSVDFDCKNSRKRRMRRTNSGGNCEDAARALSQLFQSADTRCQYQAIPTKQIT